MKVNGQDTMLNKIVLIGGVADRSELKDILAEVPYETCNFFSTNDHVLKYLYRVCKPFLEACGLGKINADNVENVDCSDFVAGHTKYRR